ncbi:MAG TPA: ABC transporter ATP-binding protein [Drouetiella sp.]|jgi:ABC-2 type transport system ATP-binding protein
MTEAAIEASKLSKDVVSSFLRKRVRVLHGLDLTVETSETYGLLGPNGAGKTTTLKILLGLMRPTEGSARVLGQTAGEPQALARVGFLPEQPYFYSHLTGREFMDFAGRLFGLDAKQRAARTKELLELVALDKAAYDKPMRKYSKGMLQRLGIAQSLVNDPDLLFWDEPMSGLDPIGRRDVRKILASLKERKKTIFFNSHLLPDVNEVCDRVGVLNHGKLVAEEKISTISSTGNYRDLEDYFLTVVGESDKSA